MSYFASLHQCKAFSSCIPLSLLYVKTNSDNDIATDMSARVHSSEQSLSVYSLIHMKVADGNSRLSVTRYAGVSTIVDELQIHMYNCLMNHSHWTGVQGEAEAEAEGERKSIYTCRRAGDETTEKKDPKVKAHTVNSNCFSTFDFFLLSPIVCALNDSSVKPMTRGGQETTRALCSHNNTVATTVTLRVREKRKKLNFCQYTS